MEVFIDTNVILSFYHLTGEDLVELEKLAVLIENKEITWFLPEQVIDETQRNRASKISESFDTLKKAKFSITYPAYCKDYEQYELMRKAQKELEQLHSEIVEKIDNDIQKCLLKADLLIDRLFKVATIIKRTPAIISRARERMEIGNPPGKKHSLGDAINWECLLEKGWKTPIYIIADDSDFSSPLNSEKINEFLNAEWVAKKGYPVHFYRKLSQFFKEHYPNINLQTEIEKDSLIEKLASSTNFSTTHYIIADLSKHESFTAKQAEDLFNALMANNQIKWIINDEDVRSFYQKLYEDHPYEIIFSDHLQEFEKLMSKNGKQEAA